MALTHGHFVCAMAVATQQLSTKPPPSRAPETPSTPSNSNQIQPPRLSWGMPVGPSRRTHHFSINNLVRESTRTDFFTIGEPVAPITIQLFSLVLSMPTSTIDAGSTVRDENGEGGQTHWCPNRRHSGKQKNICPTPNLGIVMQLEGLTSPNACRRN